MRSSAAASVRRVASSKYGLVAAVVIGGLVVEQIIAKYSGQYSPRSTPPKKEKTNSSNLFNETTILNVTNNTLSPRLDLRLDAVPSKMMNKTQETVLKVEALSNVLLGINVSDDAAISESSKMIKQFPSNGTFPFTNITNVFWLHIEKTGTSFFNTIFYHFCPAALHSGKYPLPMSDMAIQKDFPLDEWCPVKFYNTKSPNGVGFHWPYVKRQEEFLTLTMLRDPGERIRSAYAFGRHGSKLKNPEIFFHEFVNEPQIPNCQIKMILGYHCHHQVKESKLNLDLAVERIQGPLFFFGITDEWNKSICLFHKWFGGERKSFEMKNMRPTKDRKKNTTTTQPAIKDLDAALFSRAMEIFKERATNVDC